MRIRPIPAGVIVTLATICLSAAVATSGATASTASCDKATAKQLVNQSGLNDFLVSQPVAEVRCGPFTGAHSQAMLVTIAAGTCWSPQRWAVFRIGGGAWHLVVDQHVWIVPLVRAVGGDLLVTSPVLLSTDSGWDPTGGTRTETGRWNGTRFVAIASKRTPLRDGCQLKSGLMSVDRPA